MKAVLVVLVAFFSAFTASAGPLAVSQSPRDLGRVVISELSIREGKIIFRVDSNGCTDASSFKVNVRKEEGISQKIPHYRLTIERIRIDDCKAMLWDGVVVEMDLKKDMGLTGSCTLSVENPVLLKSEGSQ